MKKLLLLAVLVLGMAGSAHAVDVTIDVIEGEWQNAVKTGSVGMAPLIVNGGNSNAVDTVRWGTSSHQSGYDWQSRSHGYDQTVGTAFSLGVFTHMNQPIMSGSAIDSVELAFMVGTFDNPASLTATFDFTHEETLNTNDREESRDIVKISNGFLDQIFNDNGTNYYFTLLGFSQDDGVNISDTFYTYENDDNPSHLYAIIETGPINAVPEPATVALLGLGMVGLAGAEARRRRKTKDVDNS